MAGKRKFVWMDGRFVDVTNWSRPAPKFPAIHRDTMDALVHPATGERYDSKSRFREVTKAHGMVELGNDANNTNNVNANVSDARERKQDIKQAMDMVEQGYTAPPVESVTDWGADTRIYDAS